MFCMIKIPYLLLFFSLALGISVRAEERPASFTGKGISLELVADAKVIQPGQTFHLGLWLEHEPGYHTYWQNPGLAGVPTKLTPELPPGFTAGALIYPPPDKVKMAAINVHGYERAVLVALPIKAPADLKPGPIAFPVEATWMCCFRTCNPGHAKLSLTLQAGAAAAPDAVWAPVFEALANQQPPALEGWTLTARRFEKEVELTVAPPAGLALPSAPQFFSSDNLICSHPPQNWQPDGRGYRVRLSLSDFQPPDESHLRGLLFGKGSWLPGPPAPYVSISVPITLAGPVTAK
jgi:thiol:disulfide interchange protein DsbD